MLTTKMPLRNRDGEIIGTFGISKDITALKQTEAELSYERDSLKTLMDNFPDSIYFKDLASRFVRVSKSNLEKTFNSCLAAHRAASGAADLPVHLTGLEQFSKYVLGRTDFDFLLEKSASEMYEDEQEIIRTGTPLIGKVHQLTGLDGKTSWLLTTKMLWRDKDGKTIGTFGTTKDITLIKKAEAQVEETHKRLLELSRQAGMAEVATNVLHNVGNVLNSVNVSTTLALDLIKKSRLNNLGWLAAMIHEQRDHLAAFFATDPKGRQLPEYMEKLAKHLAAEQSELVGEIELTRKNIEHIKDIVMMQQSYARMSGVVDKVKVVDMVEDALRMNAGALARHDVQVSRDYPAGPLEITVERHKVLQVLVNLIRNAKYACDESGRADKHLTVQVRGGDQGVQIAVMDNGVGIPAENMTRIFSHGFTTRKDGHGFGLHSGALAAREMGGKLTAFSDGPDAGARFVLELPLQPPPNP